MLDKDTKITSVTLNDGRSFVYGHDGAFYAPRYKERLNVIFGFTNSDSSLIIDIADVRSVQTEKSDNARNHVLNNSLDSGSP